MVLPNNRSRALRRVKVRTSVSLRTHYFDRHVGKAYCPIEHTPLSSVPRLKKSKLRQLPKTMRRPQRPFGGVLSSRAMRALIIRKAREAKQND